METALLRTSWDGVQLVASNGLVSGYRPTAITWRTTIMMGWADYLYRAEIFAANIDRNNGNATLLTSCPGIRQSGGSGRTIC